jgi:hypothetical protein
VTYVVCRLVLPLQTSVTMLEQSDATPSEAVVADPQNEELRRLAALALMVYVAGDDSASE